MITNDFVQDYYEYLNAFHFVDCNICNEPIEDSMIVKFESDLYYNFCSKTCCNKFKKMWEHEYQEESCQQVLTNSLSN